MTVFTYYAVVSRRKVPTFDAFFGHRGDLAFEPRDLGVLSCKLLLKLSNRRWRHGLYLHQCYESVLCLQMLLHGTDDHILCENGRLELLNPLRLIVDRCTRHCFDLNFEFKRLRVGEYMYFAGVSCELHRSSASTQACGWPTAS